MYKDFNKAFVNKETIDLTHLNSGTSVYQMMDMVCTLLKIDGDGFYCRACEHYIGKGMCEGGQCSISIFIDEYTNRGR